VFSFFDRESLALQRQAMPPLGAQSDPRRAGCRRESLHENPTFVARVVDATGHALVDGVGHHRDDDLERDRKRCVERNVCPAFDARSSLRS
jgi:hypothetical protein